MARPEVCELHKQLEHCSLLLSNQGCIFDRLLERVSQGNSRILGDQERTRNKLQVPPPS